MYVRWWVRGTLYSQTVRSLLRTFAFMPIDRPGKGGLSPNPLPHFQLICYDDVTHYSHKYFKIHYKSYFHDQASHQDVTRAAKRIWNSPPWNVYQRFISRPPKHNSKMFSNRQHCLWVLPNPSYTLRDFGMNQLEHMPRNAQTEHTLHNIYVFRWLIC